MTICQAAKMCGVSPHTFRRFESGDLPDEFFAHQRIVQFAKISGK